MKDSKEYSKKIQKLYRSLKRKYARPQKVVYESIVDALVYAIVSEKMSGSATQAAMKRFADYFVDWNDLRVSRIEEIVEVLGEDTPATREMAPLLTASLRAIFNKYNVVNLEVLKKIGKRPAKQVLEKIVGADRDHFVVDYCMLTSLQGHAIPLTKSMIEYLRSNEMVHPEADEQEIEGFLARQISARNAYEFYYLLRCQSESRRSRSKKKTTATQSSKSQKRAKTTKKKK